MLGLLFLTLILMGCGSSGSKDIAPEASFTVSTDSGSYPLEVTFDASASTDSDGSISKYAWTFGDGGTGTGVSADHTYSEAGTYTAELTVTDNGGKSATATHDIDVKPQYSLSGTVTSAEYVVADSDVNDIYADYVPNDTPAEAQSISSPCSVSGYVNLPGEGPSGRSFTSGDEDDYFKATLTRGTNITLYTAEYSANDDLSLYLYASNDTSTPVDASLTVGAIDSLTVPSDGTYYIRVSATEGASIYVLILGQSGSASAQYPLRLSDDFVPGEVLVRFKDGTTGNVSATAMAATTISTLGFADKGGTAGLDRLLARSDSVGKATLFARLGVQASLAHSLAAGKADSKTTAKLETLWMIRGLRKQSDVEIAEPNYIRKAFTVPNDPIYSKQWNYPLINLPKAWSVTTGSSNVVVAVIDTGVLLKHPDLQGQLVAGYDFISDPDTSQDGDGVDDNPDDPGDGDVGGSSFHGTHVAGTIAAASNNAIGVAGVAWGVKIMPLRVLGKGGGTSYDIIQAVKYAAGLATDYSGIQLDSPVDIINLSLGGTGYSETEAEVYAEARAQGVIIVAAAGNTGSTTKTYPAAYDGVVSVSAVGYDESLAPYSNYGSTIDVAAPGGSQLDQNGDGVPDWVWSTLGDDSSGTIEMIYGTMIGTSMAAPHVTGVAALMKSLYSGLTPDKFDALLQGGYLTQDLGDSGRDDKYGYGLIDAYKAVLIAKEGGDSGGLPAILTVTPSTLSFGSFIESTDVTVKNGGGGEALTLSSYTSDSSWLTVTPSDVDSDTGLGTYTVAADRSSLSDGTYTGKVTFESTDGEETTVSVSMQVGTAAVSLDGGYHYVVLLDPDTLSTIDTVGVAPDSSGQYSYEFSGLSYGDSYLVYAGTDPNNDDYICDEGESCGAYLSVDQPTTLTIDGDMTGIDFTTNISMSLPTGTTSQFAAEGWPLQRLQRKAVREVSK